MAMAFRRFAAAATLLAASLLHAQADDYPARPVTLIVPWAAGGAVDTLARIVQPKLAERLGKPVVIENRPGGGSTIGTAAGAKAQPDGYLLNMPGSGSLAISATMYKALPYDSVRDFAPMALVGRVPFVLIVNKDLPIKSVADLVKYAKSNKLNYGSGGAGSPHHLYAEMLKGELGIEMTHVPYKGSADAIKDVVAGHIQIMFSDTAPSIPLIRNGTVTLLGLSTSTRLPTAPDIAPLAESGVPGFEAAGWFMVSGSAGTPKPIVDRLHKELREIMGLKDVQDAVNRTGVVPVVSPSPADLTKFVITEKERWGKVVTRAGLAGTL
jgi:tripartite-type tricarboxylate transporter receptor subunit TctC